jgi:glycosyltransferase involved in cell wall biosynthesis
MVDTRAGPGAEAQYQQACQVADGGKHTEARRLYQDIEPAADLHLLARIRNDVAALAAVEGDLAIARQGFESALALNDQCTLARDNLGMLLENEPPAAETAVSAPAPSPGSAIVPCQPAASPPALAGASGLGAEVFPGPQFVVPAAPATDSRAVKVAIVSFLFNWPSTGGGIVHTVELAQFLARAGYAVRHFYTRHLAWGVGKIEQKLPFPSEALWFDEATWTVPAIQDGFRRAVDAFGPDYIIITDSWNMKPLLAEAVGGYPYFLRLQAMECLCPLNNVRLLYDGAGRFRQCPLNQLANPAECSRCLRENGRCSGGLHQAERALCGVGTPQYHEKLLRALREAEAVLVVNPLTEALVRPYARDVRVVTAGMDLARFPWPWHDQPKDRPVVTLFFAGLVEELMKGFAVLHEACARLWKKRQDFELVAPGDPPGPVDAFTRFVGWLSQEELPRHLRAADVLVMPTVAQEALGRTAVEAMAVGRPVIASRLGGLPFTVVEGVTGLLCAPGDPDDLARKIERLLDDPALRERLGLAGRRRFEEHYDWNVIIDRHYKPLLCRRARRPEQPVPVAGGAP